MILPRRYRAVAFAAAILAVGSCSGQRVERTPSNQADLCAIFAEFPHWRDAAIASSARWGAPVEVQMAIIWRESSFRAAVRPRKTYILGVIPDGHISSAYGYAQAIDGTWDWYRKDTGNGGADRTRFEDAADFVGWYMAQTERQNGVGMYDAYNQYLAYHEGHGGHRARSFLEKDWLIQAARDVASRAASYRGQLRNC